MHGLRTQPWVWLDQTATTAVHDAGRICRKRKAGMWDASLAVVDKIEEIAA